MKICVLTKDNFAHLKLKADGKFINKDTLTEAEKSSITKTIKGDNLKTILGAMQNCPIHPDSQYIYDLLEINWCISYLYLNFKFWFHNLVTFFYLKAFLWNMIIGLGNKKVVYYKYSVFVFRWKMWMGFILESFTSECIIF